MQQQQQTPPAFHGSEALAQALQSNLPIKRAGSVEVAQPDPKRARHSGGTVSYMFIILFVL